MFRNAVKWELLTYLSFGTGLEEGSVLVVV